MPDGAVELALPPATAGFCGKLPARGDFVESGLPRAFVAGWDRWWEAALTASRDRLGEGWTEAWLQAPVWRFRLAAGCCGPEAALGLWMPSVDRVGRHFPLTLAAVGAEAALDALGYSGFLERAEAAGRHAVAQDDAPETLREALETGDGAFGAGWLAPEGPGCVWWTSGAPGVPPGVLRTGALPEPDMFVRMLDGCDD